MRELQAGLIMVAVGAGVLVAFWAGAFSAIATELVAVVRGGPGAGAQPALDVQAGPGPAPSAERSA